MSPNAVFSPLQDVLSRSFATSSKKLTCEIVRKEHTTRNLFDKLNSCLLYDKYIDIIPLTAGVNGMTTYARKILRSFLTLS